jgi:alpha(1,3/1,4) fucosyltransferase
MKPTIKVGFTDTYMDLMPPFFMHVLSERYNVIRDDINPEFLIFGDENFGINNRNYDQNKVVKIFYTGENRRPWSYDCKYALTFDHYDAINHYRLPLYVLEIWALQNFCNYPDMIVGKMQEPKPKTKFCGFVSSNPHVPMRENIFHLINQYKMIDSAGPALNTTGYLIPRNGFAGVATKIDWLRDYKFTLCYENSTHPGYITEKIMNAYYARSIPIYWGSTTSEVDFNPKSFINWHDDLSDKKLIDKIIELDHNDNLYNDMVNQPPFVDNKPNKFMNLERLRDWFDLVIKRR